MPTPVLATFVLLLLGASAVGCGIRRQLGDMRAFADSHFRIIDAERAEVAGVDVRHVRRPSDLGVSDVARLVAAGAAGSLPLDLTFDVEARNSSSRQAVMRRFDWRLRLDAENVAHGRSDRLVELPPGAAARFPLTAHADLQRLVGGRGRDAVVAVAVGLVDPDRRPSRLSLQVRPTFDIGGREVRAPGFVTVASPSDVVPIGAPAMPLIGFLWVAHATTSPSGVTR